jgi:hypothetical protein
MVHAECKMVYSVGGLARKGEEAVWHSLCCGDVERFSTTACVYDIWVLEHKFGAKGDRN